MNYANYNRGTITGRIYRYAGCHIWWNGENWLAHSPFDSNEVIATAKGIKPLRDKLRDMKFNKQGPWEVQDDTK